MFTARDQQHWQQRNWMVMQGNDSHQLLHINSHVLVAVMERCRVQADCSSLHLECLVMVVWSQDSGQMELSTMGRAHTRAHLQLPQRCHLSGLSAPS